MKITLAQAVPLRSIISRYIADLLEERDSVSTVETIVGEKYEKPVRSVDDVTIEIERSRKDFRRLDTSMAEMNLQAKVFWDDKEISITEAIELAKQLREEVNVFKEYGKRKKQTLSSNWHHEEKVMIHTLYDPEEYRKKALKLERQVNRLSQDIEAKNHQVEFEFKSATRYLDY
ncbi:DIP1984 family protein [Bacillus carboniphilus]|uniref:DIP1984 family protein n=1 Tax=Bacillus carboniphilus TaxID=86663 RepID=A0ABY9JU68_9BACI|nr:DIP1984 family protein [Bacillus carboniphilus]WLR41210.1 DIP1984 family protein [Bacillus carboniphilus]